MKKTIFSFAIAAVAALTMASCSGKAAGENNGADSTNVTEATEQVKGTVFDNDGFSVTYPEKWSKLESSKEDWPRMKQKFDDGNDVTLQITLDESVAFADVEGFANARLGDYKENKALDPVTIGDHKFLVVQEPAHGAYGDAYGLYAAIPNVEHKFVRVWVENSKDGKITPESPEIKEVLETLKLK